MVFSSIPFLFYFLPLVLIFYFISPKKLKNCILFLFSLLFYAWGEPIYVILMLFSTVVDYTHGIWIEKFLDRSEKNNARIILLSSMIINISLLCFFKYSDFFIDNINLLFSLDIPLLQLPLPIGISFYTFQTMSYSIDVYRKEVSAQKNIISFGAYVVLFPQLIAGPIIRYQTIAKELDNRQETIESFAQGATRFIQGLGKKVILANNIGFLWETISTSNLSTLPIATAWLGLIAFAFQIYFDFSGYSDMAIGLGAMFGFHFPENFNYPYTSKSITEFWRRWHISLGTWFKEYVYIPLGGNRRTTKRTIFNIMFVWCLTGFWHGSAWNFILWGLYFGIILIIEKQFLAHYLQKSPKVICHIYTCFLILLGWYLFAFDDINRLQAYGKILFGINQAPLWNQETLYYLSSYGILLIILVISSTPLPKQYMKEKFENKKDSLGISLLSSGFMILIFLLSVAFIINSSYNPFLYFRF